MKYGEKYKTAVERSNAFYDYCKMHPRCEGCDLLKHQEARCIFLWLEVEIESPQCPFCGGELVEFSVDDKSKYVFRCTCPTCRFLSPIFTSRTRKELVDVLKSMAKARKESAVK